MILRKSMGTISLRKSYKSPKKALILEIVPLKSKHKLFKRNKNIKIAMPHPISKILEATQYITTLNSVIN